MPKRNTLTIAVLAGVVLAAGAALYIYKKTPPKPVPVPETPFVYTPPDNREVIRKPSGVSVLPDSTKVILIDTSTFTKLTDFRKRREVKVDGDMFFDVADSPKPFIVRTRLLTLTVTGKSQFRVIAYRKEDGEEVQVISGNIHVKKSYKSQFSEPETLTANQMVMINITIDLMEKEKFDSRDLQLWRDSARIMVGQ